MNKTFSPAIAFALIFTTAVSSCSEPSVSETDNPKKATNETTDVHEPAGSENTNPSDGLASSDEKKKDAPTPPPPPPPQKIRFIEPRIVEDIGPDESYALVDRERPMNVGIVDGPYHDGSGDYEEIKSEGDVLFFSDPMPEFPGGQAKLNDYLKSNIKYPVEAREMGIEGKVYVGFVVKTDGTISDVQVRRGVHQTLDREAIRVIKSMPNWIPGKQDGKPVNVQMTIPVKFTLTQ